MKSKSPPLRALLLSLAMGCSLLLSPLAYAEPSEADRLAARTLVVEGRKKLAAGDAQGALEFFQKAHGIMHVPTTGLDLAKAHQALGELAEAWEALSEVTKMPVHTGEPEAFTNARAEAAQILESLTPKLPSVLLHINGAPLSAIKATIDGKEIPSAELEFSRILNPGSHTIVVTGPEVATWEDTVTLTEGVKKPVEIEVKLVPSAKKAAPRGASAEATNQGKWMTAAFWGSAGLAVVGLGLGIGFSVAAAGKAEAYQDELRRLEQSTSASEKICPLGLEDPRCQTLADLGQTQNAFAYTAMGGFIAGGLGAAGALTLALMRPKAGDAGPPKPVSIRVTPTLSGLVVSGSF